MSTRRNHGAWVMARRNQALTNNLRRLQAGYHNVLSRERKLTDKARACIEREVEVLTQRGATT